MSETESTARKEQEQRSSSNTQEGEIKKGPEFMSLRFNVRAKRREIRRNLTPLQNYLLDDITEGTVNEWDSKNEFDLKDLAAGLKVTPNRVYEMVKDLEALKIIIRKPTRYRGREILGLNPELFGQVLTDHQNDLEKRRHLRVVPISSPPDPKPTEGVGRDSDSTSRESDHSSRDSDSGSRESDTNAAQQSENKQEKTPLDPLDSFKSLRGENGDSDSRSPEGSGPVTGEGWDPNGHLKARAIIKAIGGGLKRMPL